MGGSVASIATGGLSDVVSGNAPGSAALNAVDPLWQMAISGKPVDQAFSDSLANQMTGGVYSELPRETQKQLTPIMNTATGGLYGGLKTGNFGTSLADSIVGLSTGGASDIFSDVKRIAEPATNMFNFGLSEGLRSGNFSALGQNLANLGSGGTTGLVKGLTKRQGFGQIMEQAIDPGRTADKAVVASGEEFGNAFGQDARMIMGKYIIPAAGAIFAGVAGAAGGSYLGQKFAGNKDYNRMAQGAGIAAATTLAAGVAGAYLAPATQGVANGIASATGATVTNQAVQIAAATATQAAMSSAMGAAMAALKGQDPGDASAMGAMTGAITGFGKTMYQPFMSNTISTLTGMGIPEGVAKTAAEAAWRSGLDAASAAVKDQDVMAAAMQGAGYGASSGFGKYIDQVRKDDIQETMSDPQWYDKATGTLGKYATDVGKFGTDLAMGKDPRWAAIGLGMSAADPTIDYLAKSAGLSNFDFGRDVAPGLNSLLRKTDIFDEIADYQRTNVGRRRAARPGVYSGGDDAAASVWDKLYASGDVDMGLPVKPEYVGSKGEFAAYTPDEQQKLMEGLYRGDIGYEELFSPSEDNRQKRKKLVEEV